MTSEKKLTEFTNNDPENDDTSTSTTDTGTDGTGPETFGEYFGGTNTNNDTSDGDTTADNESSDNTQQQDTGSDTDNEDEVTVGAGVDDEDTTGDVGSEYMSADHAVGAPDGWIAAGDDPNTGTDHRIPARIDLDGTHTRPGKPSETTDDSDIVIPVKKVGATGITKQQLKEYGITKDEARFMRAVVKGMNRTLEGYDLTESMTDIVSHYDVNEERLVEHGHLKRHTGACRRRYFTVTHDGQKACGMTKEHGREIGDLGADTMHRVGIDLARDYYETQDHVRRVELSVREHGNETDLIVVDTDGNRDAIIEIEAGQIPNDPDVTNNNAGINNYNSIRKDYEILAESSGEAVWVVRNAEVAGTVLRALNASKDIPADLSNDVIERVEDTRLKIPTLNENHLGPMNANGIDKIVTFKQLRIWLR